MNAVDTLQQLEHYRNCVLFTVTSYQWKDNSRKDLWLFKIIIYNYYCALSMYYYTLIVLLPIVQQWQNNATKEE